MAKVFIDKKPYVVDPTRNMLETCLSLGLNLPYFCWHPAMGSVGACRQCAIIKYKDAADQKGKIVMACMEPVADNMHISIEAEEAHQFRAGNIEALMTNHPHDCPVCDEGGECHLQDMTVMTGHNYRRYDFKKRTHNNQYLGPFVNHEMNRCIECYRCVRFYKDYAGGKDLDVFATHNDVYFGRHEDGILENEFSGNLVEVCPTGVFTDKTLKKHYTRKWDLTNAPSVCHQCSLGCNTIASERYGSIRRITSRYNGDVNSYFLCDRGRFGYEYVNSEKRIHTASKKLDGIFSAIPSVDAVKHIKKLIAANQLTGIGSPMASLESNFLLRQLVGNENFYAGIPAKEGKLIQKIIGILKSGKVQTPSLNAVKDYDAVFILGEDVTNTAPMLALSLRQAVKNQPRARAEALKIPDWNAAAVKEAEQEESGPLYSAMAHTTRLDDIATKTYRGNPNNIALLGYSVAHRINDQSPAVIHEQTELLTLSISEALMAAKKPLIVAGTSLYSEAIIQAAANIAYALKDKGKNVGLVYVVPEVNSIGLCMIGDQFLEDAFEKAADIRDKTLFILENDLFKRIDANKADNFLSRFKDIVTLDYLENETTQKSTYNLPAGTFAEADGTIINNEGRAQRFYQVFVPENELKSSWKWIEQIVNDENDHPERNLDAVISDLVKILPVFRDIQFIAPHADFREDTQKIPREMQGYSGRTAMHADVNISEPKPPVDADSPLSFTMEGYSGIPPSSIIPFYWAPGWNSVQAINKYQIEVGGPLHGGNPGKRLFEITENSKASYFGITVESVTQSESEYLVLPLYHIFGSDELSALSPAIAERMPSPYIALNNNDALKAGIAEGDKVEILLNGSEHILPVKLNIGLPGGTAGLPKGLNETAGVSFPFTARLNKAGNE